MEEENQNMPEQKKLGPGLIVAVVLSLLVVLLGAYFFISGQSLGDLRERFSASPTPTTTVETTPTPEPVTFTPEEGTVKGISGRTLALATLKGLRKVEIADSAHIYKFTSEESADAPPLSEEVDFADIKVGDELTLFWTGQEELKAVYIAYK